MKRKIIIPGGNGFLGRIVARHMHDIGWDVIVLTRRADAKIDGATAVAWDGRSLGDWTRELEGVEVVLNLAGRSVNCRYNAKNRREIEMSRVESTAILGQAIALTKNPPRVWLNSSTATIYRHAEDRPQDEFSGKIGSGFSVNVAKVWEKTFFESATPFLRKIALRTAIVMGPGDGAPLKVFRTLVRFRLGGRMGSGRQFVSWIHIDDFCRAIEFLIEHDELSDCVNIASPNPVSNAQFMRDLRQAAGVRIGLPAAKWMLSIGAFFLRTETELPLKSRYVVPKRLLDMGFEFEHPTWPQAPADLLRRF